MYEEIDRIVGESEIPLTYSMIADHLSVRLGRIFTDEQVRSAMRRAEKRAQYDSYRATRFPVEAKERAFSARLDVSLDSVTVIADLHVPYHSPSMLQRVIDMSALLSSRDLVIAGDLFNFDSVSKWPNSSEPESLQTELITAGELLLELSRHYDRMYILSGNHDEWLGRAANAHLRMNDLVSMALARNTLSCSLTVTDYDYMYANVYGQPWVFGHLSQFSKRPGEIARKISERHSRNVAVGHDHIQGYTSSEDGKFLCVSIGAMISLDDDGSSPMWYKERRLNSFAPVQNGFLILDKGVPMLFNEFGSSSLNGNRNWSHWYSAQDNKSY
jgi:hypothetical protein